MILKEMKYLYILLLVLGISCSENNFENPYKSEVEAKVENGLLGSYIDKNIYEILEEECLNQIVLSLEGVLWNSDLNNKISFGINFKPKSIINKSELKSKKDAKWLAFERIEIRESIDTSYFVEVYVYEKELNSFKPCHLLENGAIYIDSLFLITPDLKVLDNNCILEVTNNNMKKGVWREVDEEHNVIGKGNPTLPHSIVKNK